MGLAGELRCWQDKRQVVGLISRRTEFDSRASYMEADLSEAKQTLLRALESIEEAEREMDAEVQFLCVTYEMHRRTDQGNIAHSGGWNHSDAPDWVIAAMLRRAADAIERQDPIDEKE